MSQGSPAILILFSNRFTFTTSNALLKSRFARRANSPSLSALANADWIDKPAVVVLLPLLNPC